MQLNSPICRHNWW